MEARGFSGLTELARSWPGRVIVLAPAVNDIPEPLPLAYATADVDSLGFDIVKAQPVPAEIDSLGLDLTLGLLAPHWRGVTEVRTPAVLTAEVDYGIRLAIHRATSSGIPLAS
ncbi:hypothetical protein [Micrococcus sp. Alg238-R198]|uniref:hypothetical protein n=1 Tax=Micrococcus sp. Alg238-R198 TaxID=2305988 RepID=UPI0013D5D4FE|nr:hypothetical protein [Micrococcus sp. Alg238-R198]